MIPVLNKLRGKGRREEGGTAGARQGGDGAEGRGRMPHFPGGNGDKCGFHGVEVFPKVASMVWKNGENDFHGVEDFAERRLSLRGEKWMILK